MPECANDERAVLAAKLLNEFTQKSRQVLCESEINKKRKQEGKMPASIILSRDAGDSLPKFKPIRESTGLNFACFVQMPVEKGIALLCKMNIVDVPLPCGDLDKDMALWADVAARKINEFDGLYIHIKGPDEPAHDGDFVAKKDTIESIDKHFFGRLLAKVNREDYLICVTADHSTVCKVKAHTGDPVPVLIYGAAVSDETTQFGETQAKTGSLGAFLGKELIYKLREFATQ